MPGIQKALWCCLSPETVKEDRREEEGKVGSGSQRRMERRWRRERDRVEESEGRKLDLQNEYNSRTTGKGGMKAGERQAKARPRDLPAHLPGRL